MGKNKFNKVKYTFICVLISIFILIFVHIIYSIPSPCEFLVSKWNAGDLISYIGTMFLGIIAIVQTLSANNLSKKLLDIEMSRKKHEQEPFFLVTNCSVKKFNSYFTMTTECKPNYTIEIENIHANQIVYLITFEIVNTSDNVEIIRFKECYSTDNDNKKEIKWKNNGKPSSMRHIVLLSKQNGRIHFICNQEMYKSLENRTFKMEFYINNKVYDTYLETFTCYILKIKEDCISHHCQDYIINETSDKNNEIL